MHKLINDRDDLYKRENRRVKFDLLVCRLVQFSETDLDVDDVTPENLQDISEQWFVTSADVEPNSSCLCSQGEVDGEEVRYVTYIRNRFTGYVARIGSTCIEKFGDGNSIKEEVKLLFSLMKKHSVRVNPTLAEAMAKQNIITELELALIKEIGRKTKLEQDAINTLSVLKAKIAIEKIPPSVTDIAEWIEAFVRKNSESPEFTSPYDSKKVTVSKRLIDEYRELRKKLLIADASEYEKQTVIRVLGAFYSQELNIVPEPKKERPNLEQCQLDKFQVNQCSAEQMIHAAELKIENYIDSRTKNITEEKETYTTLSVLLDAYQRFNGAVYNIDLLDGIQESIARLEVEVEKIPSALSEFLFNIEEKLKGDLYQNIKEIEDDVRQRHDVLRQELQQVRVRLSHEVEKTISDSKELLGKVEVELKKLKKETSNLISEYTSRVQQIEEDVWSTINSRNIQIDSLEEIAENNQSNISDLITEIDSLQRTTENNRADVDDLNRKIDDLTTNLRTNLERISTHLNVINTAINNVVGDVGAVRRDLNQAQESSRVKLWAVVIVVLSLNLISFLMINSRLSKLEVEQRRANPTLRQLP